MSWQWAVTTSHPTDQAIAGWEKNSKVPIFADQMLRVFYAAHADGNEQVKNIVYALNDVERTIHFVMTETKQGWQSKISEVDLSERDEFERVV